MNRFVQEGILMQQPGGKNLSYLLNEPELFSASDYKFMQGSKSGVLVRCVMAVFNGKTQLLYLKAKLSSLADLLPQMDPQTFIVIVENIFLSLGEVRRNGFLRCEKIDLSADRIFVDQNCLTVHLIYLPLKEELYENESQFTEDLRWSLAKLILNRQNLSSSATRVLLSKLQDPSVTLEMFIALSAGRKKNDRPEEPPLTYITGLTLKGISPGAQICLKADQDEYVIGRSPASADGVISGNRLIGRTHCRILRQSDGCYVTDLSSVNGTFLNGERLPPGQPRLLKDGDILRLADTELEVVINRFYEEAHYSGG